MHVPMHDVWIAFGAICVLAITIWASADAILNKREVHASISWAAVIWLAPGVGALAYLLLGRNRIRRRAVELRASAPRLRALPAFKQVTAVSVLPMSQLGVQFDLSFTIAGLDAASPSERPRAAYRGVMPGYFEALEIPVREGRTFDPRRRTERSDRYPSYS